MKTLNNKTRKQHQSNLSSLIRAGLLSIAALFTSTLYAESVAISVADQSHESIQKPRHGQKMENVEAQFGQPIERVSPVGEPPITRWVYQGFTVYFEHNIVLHTVLDRG